MPPTSQPRTMNILFANDGSSHALAALELIIDLPLPSETIVHAIGVLIPRESSNHAVLENVLDDTKRKLEKKPVIARTEIKLGYPQEILIEYAEELDPDLIVIGAKGLRSTLGILLGGVAQQIVEYATRPVLIVRAPYKSIKKVALVTDGSIYSDHAVDYLAGTITERDEPMECTAFPFHEDVRLQVIHVLPPIPSPQLLTRSWPIGTEMIPIYEPDMVNEEEWMAQKKPKGEAIINSALEQLRDCGFESDGELLWGDAGTEIIDYVKTHDIDLIVAGSRGLSQMRGWFLGSVSRKLVHYSDCSVLIVKTKQTNQ